MRRYGHYGGGEDRGSGGGGPPPSDTLLVHVTDLRYPVTEETLREVFSPIAMPVSIQMLPSPGGNAIAAMLRFQDARAAESARRQRHGRNIYTECNKMSVTFATPEGSESYSAGSRPAAILGAPSMQSQGGYGGPQGGAMYDSYGGGSGGGMQYPPQQSFPGMPGMPPGGGYGAYPGQYEGQPQAMPFPRGGPPQRMPMSGRGFDPMGGGDPNRGGRGGGAPTWWKPPIHIPMMPGVPQMYPPMPMHPGMAPYGYPQMRNPMGDFGRAGYPISDRRNEPRDSETMRDSCFASAASVPENVSLLFVFRLFEAFGGVVSLKRNYSKPHIVTVRLESPQAAHAVTRSIRHIPFFGSTLSIKIFPGFVERNPPVAEGDPADCEVKGFDFTEWPHRPSSDRSKCGPTTAVCITGLSSSISTAEIVEFLSRRGIGQPIATSARDSTDTGERQHVLEFSNMDDSLRVLGDFYGTQFGENSDDKFIVTFDPSGKRSDELQELQQQQQQALAEQGGEGAIRVTVGVGEAKLPQTDS